MSSKEITVALADQYIGKRVSGEHNSGWGDYWYFDGKLLSVEPTDQYTYLEICECRTTDECDEEIGTHGGFGFWPEDKINVHW